MSRISLLTTLEGLIGAGDVSEASVLLEQFMKDHPDQVGGLTILHRILSRPERRTRAVGLAIQAIELLHRRGLDPTDTVEQREPNGEGQWGDGIDSDFSQEDCEYVEQASSELQERRQHFHFPEHNGASVDQLSQTVTAPDVSLGATRSDKRTGGPEPDRSLERPAASEALGEPSSVLSDAEAHAERDPCSEIAEPEYEEHAPETDSGLSQLHMDGHYSPDEGFDDATFLEDDTLAQASEDQDELEGGDVLDHFEEQDWTSLDAYLHDVDEEPGREELEREIQTEGPVSRKQRALQQATELGTQYGWETPEIAILARAFEKYWWSAAKVSMVRELEAGMLPDELDLALTAREIWNDHDEFAVNLGGYSFPALSWPLALRIVRSFHSYPDSGEIEIFLNDAFLQWQADISLTRRHPSFHDYLANRLVFPAEDYMVSPGVSLGTDYREREDDYFAGSYSGFNTQHYRALIEYNLIPDIWATGLRVVARKEKNSEGNNGSRSEVADD
jgi:hypothetical protein